MKTSNCQGWNAAALAASFAFLMMANGSRASDGDLQRALLEASCVKADIKQLSREGPVVVYEANCFNSAHQLLKILCVKGRCSVARQSVDLEEE